MMHELSTETLARKNPRGRDHHRAVGFSHQACRLLHRGSITNHHNRCYACSSGDRGLSDMEAKARLQLVRKEGYHGTTFHQ